MFSFFKYFGISDKNDIFDFTSWHQFSASQLGWKSTIFIRLACCIYWAQKSCSTTILLHNFSLSKNAELQENWINSIIYWGTKAECSPTLSSLVGEKNSHFICHISEIQNILDSNYIGIGLSIYVKFSLGKWLGTRQWVPFELCQPSVHSPCPNYYLYLLVIMIVYHLPQSFENFG